MGTTKRIVCLANSRKWQGRCIAGREYGVAQAGWVRPVSNRPQGELTARERLCQNRGEPWLLDIIEVPLIASRPKDYQRENWLIDPGRRWKKVGTLPWSSLERFACPAGFTLWSDGCSSLEGKNDRVPFEEAKSFSSSLELVYVDDFRLRISDSVDAFGEKKRKVRAFFKLGEVEYALQVTDPAIEARAADKSDGFYRVGPRYLTVSLGEEFHGHCYNLVAAVMEKR